MTTRGIIYISVIWWHIKLRFGRWVLPWPDGHFYCWLLGTISFHGNKKLMISEPFLIIESSNFVEGYFWDKNLFLLLVARDDFTATKPTPMFSSVSKAQIWCIVTTS